MHRATLGTVVVPEITVVSPYEMSPWVWVLIAVGVVGVLGVVAIALAAPGLAEHGIRPLGAVLGASVVMLGGLGGAAWVQTSEEAEHDAEVAAQFDAEIAARAEVESALEQWFGVDLPDNPLIPVYPDASTGPQEVRLADGRAAQCRIGSYGGTYEIRCGGDTWDAAEPLPAHGEGTS